MYECETITLVCEAKRSSIPVKNIYIYHGGKLLNRNIDRTSIAGGESRSLRIAEVKKKHEGTYYCVAENKYGLGHNKTISFTVHGKWVMLGIIEINYCDSNNFCNLGADPAF